MPAPMRTSTLGSMSRPSASVVLVYSDAHRTSDRSRVIAGTDCGFGTFAGREYVADEIVWVKLGAASEGARIASRRLWGRAGD